MIDIVILAGFLVFAVFSLAWLVKQIAGPKA